MRMQNDYWWCLSSPVRVRGNHPPSRRATPPRNSKSLSERVRLFLVFGGRYGRSDRQEATSSVRQAAGVHMRTGSVG